MQKLFGLEAQEWAKVARAMALATRVACYKVGDGNSNDGDGNKGDMQVTAMRVMMMATVMAMATTWVMALVMRLAGDKEGKGNGDVRLAGEEEGEGSKAIAMRMVGKWTEKMTKRAMALVTRVAGNKEDNANCNKSNGEGTKVGMRATATWTMATRVACKGQQQGQWQWQRQQGLCGQC